MPITPKEQEGLDHERKKKKIANTFTDDVALDSYEEGAEQWMVAIIEGIILAVIAILLVSPDPITKVAAIVATVITGFFALLGIVYLLIRSGTKFIEAKKRRDKEEEEEDERHKHVLNGLP
jgi:hypothetical protein